MTKEPETKLTLAEQMARDFKEAGIKESPTWEPTGSTGILLNSPIGKTLEDMSDNPDETPPISE